jgi:hypothetical protein
LRRNAFPASSRARLLLVFVPASEREANLDLALRLNVLAAFAAFVFVGAVLLGAF